MSQKFAEAIAALQEQHGTQSWNALSQAERARLIYAEIRRIDPNSVKGWIPVVTESGTLH